MRLKLIAIGSYTFALGFLITVAGPLISLFQWLPRLAQLGLVLMGIGIVVAGLAEARK